METIKTEGTVSLSVSELDRLRTQISDLTKERNNLLLHAKEVKLNILVEDSYLSSGSAYDWENARYNTRTWGGASLPKKIEALKRKRILEQSSSYIGLDETIQEIRKEEEQKVIQKLGELERTILDLQRGEQQLKTDHKKKLDEVNGEWRKQLEAQDKANKTEQDLKQAEIDRLNGVVTDKTKDQEIAELKRAIETLKLKKSFWGFIHS